MGYEKSRVTLLHGSGLACGRGFVVDARHVVTCVHVVGYAREEQPTRIRLGAAVSIRSDSSDLIACTVARAGGPGNWSDICILERADGGTFAAEEIARWSLAKPGMTFSGLGASAKVSSGVPIYGTIVAIGDHSETLIITAENLDTRIEPGCSGAAVFGVPSGAVLGMVATYQQERTGTLIAAQTIAEYWEAFEQEKPPQPVSFPSLSAPRPPALAALPRFETMIGEIDRIPQRNGLVNALSDRNLFRKGGIVITSIAGCEQDLPDLCAEMLHHVAFQRLIARIAPDTAKRVEPVRGLLRNLLDDDPEEARRNLRSLIATELSVAGAGLGELRKAVAATIVPLPIVLEARPGDMPRVTPAIIAAWADLIEDLARPSRDQPIALFIVARAPDGGDQATAAILAPPGEAPYFVPLKALTPIVLDDVEFWARTRFGSDEDGKRVCEHVTAIVKQRAAGRPDFRLGELNAWLSEGA
ncbi:trypsin-like peptidase domain-containing protein [Novosphingobium sp. 9U]|uniref:trypsin-like peptidase domain-containing protein n=1 Tax=Novosphingobium sp. 9U TaxID=2653158 RepID=UPI0012EEE359|nr:trypsin-like peptidase domain-containing protein [Novosphingobium sp. 9U]VWX54607.1 hypothetical protein NOVOSPHI9U_680019 [Novosphingobium sp. 9U]